MNLLKNKPFIDLANREAMIALTLRLVHENQMAMTFATHCHIENAEMVSECPDCGTQVVNLMTRWTPVIPLRYLRGLDLLLPSRRRACRKFLSETATESVIDVVDDPGLGVLFETNGPPILALTDSGVDPAEIVESTDCVVLRTYELKLSARGLAQLDQYEAEHGEVVVP